MTRTTVERTTGNLGWQPRLSNRQAVLPAARRDRWRVTGHCVFPDVAERKWSRRSDASRSAAPTALATTSVIGTRRPRAIHFLDIDRDGVLPFSSRNARAGPSCRASACATDFRPSGIAVVKRGATIDRTDFSLPSGSLTLGSGGSMDRFPHESPKGEAVTPDRQSQHTRLAGRSWPLPISKPRA